LTVRFRNFSGSKMMSPGMAVSWIPAIPESEVPES